MSKSANIRVINPGPGVGPFNLYALDSSNNIIQTIELNVSLATLTNPAGYIVFNLPDDTVLIKIQSNNALCTTSYIVELEQPPACNCYTITNLTTGVKQFTYVDCNEDTIGPVSLNFDYEVIQYCGSAPTITVGNLKEIEIIPGTRCISGDCVRGSFTVRNCTPSLYIEIDSVMPSRLYSFNTPPTFPDNPTIGYPIAGGGSPCDEMVGVHIPYGNNVITVNLKNNSTDPLDALYALTVKIYINGVLVESRFYNLPYGGAINQVQMNLAGNYSINAADDVIVLVTGA